MSSNVAFDLCILNDGATKLGYYSSEHIGAVIINDTLTTATDRQGQISMPIEFWLTADGKQTLMVVRSSASDMRSFCEEFVSFINTHGFANVALLTSAFSPIKRERDSNREIPEVFAYCNDIMEATDYYNQNGIRKYGWWIEKKKPL
jgi:ABC-type branched-subunit amino acid transport system substrate-binding protein